MSDRLVRIHVRTVREEQRIFSPQVRPAAGDIWADSTCRSLPSTLSTAPVAEEEELVPQGDFNMRSPSPPQRELTTRTWNDTAAVNAAWGAFTPAVRPTGPPEPSPGTGLVMQTVWTRRSALRCRSCGWHDLPGSVNNPSEPPLGLYCPVCGGLR